jgi:hypothetical protein
MSVSFIYQNLTFYYRIDSHSSALVFIAWGCRELPISGEAHSKEHMMEDIKAKLRQYYRNRSLPARETKVCTDCGITLQGRENETNKCDQHDFE